MLISKDKIVAPQSGLKHFIEPAIFSPPFAWLIAGTKLPGKTGYVKINKTLYSSYNKNADFLLKIENW